MSSTPSSNGSTSLANVRTETSTLARRRVGFCARSVLRDGRFGDERFLDALLPLVGEVVASLLEELRPRVAAFAAAGGSAATFARRTSGIGPRGQRARLRAAPPLPRGGRIRLARTVPLRWLPGRRRARAADARARAARSRARARARARRRLVTRSAHELIAREQLAQLCDALRTRRLFGRRDAVARRGHTRFRQQRRREPARRIDLEIAEHSRHGAFDGKRRERRALHEVGGRVALDDEERIRAERARVLGRDRCAQRRVDSRGELLGGDLRAAKCLPLELAVGLRDQDAGRHGERQEEHREHDLQPALVDAPQERALHELTTNR